MVSNIQELLSEVKKGIEPGVTISELVNNIGEPDYARQEGEFVVYQYSKIPSKAVKYYFKDNILISITAPNNTEKIKNVDHLVQLLGYPEEVRQAPEKIQELGIPRPSYLLWPEQGIAASTVGVYQTSEVDRIEVFSPTTLSFYLSEIGPGLNFFEVVFLESDPFENFIIEDVNSSYNLDSAEEAKEIIETTLSERSNNLNSNIFFFGLVFILIVIATAMFFKLHLFRYFRLNIFSRSKIET